MNTITTKEEFLDWISETDSDYIEKGFKYNNYRVGGGMLTLNKIVVEEIDISYKSFVSTEFKNCAFVGCDFKYSVFLSCTFSNCKFFDCKLYESKFLDLDLIDSSFESCTILNIELSDVIAERLLFIDCLEILDLTIRGFGSRIITFNRCYLGHIDIQPIYFGNSFPKEKNSEKIDFKDCVIKESSFNRIDLTKSVFRDCSLSLNQISSCELSNETFDYSNKTPGNEFNMIDIRTILNSPTIENKVLENIFGINNSDIKELLIDLTSEIQFQSIFISYSFKDQQFAKSINEILNNKGIKTFLWENDSPGGKTLKNIMSSTIKEKDRVLFISSKDSIKSEACQFELSKGREKQEITWSNVLFPIHIDNFLFDLEKDQIRPIENQDEYWKNIEELRKLNSLDFSCFVNPESRIGNKFEKLIYRLIKGLRK